MHVAQSGLECPLSPAVPSLPCCYHLETQKRGLAWLLSLSSYSHEKTEVI